MLCETLLSLLLAATPSLLILARKLKKEWVEKKKIKAQWKHEKRKGNIEWPKKPENAEELAGETTTRTVTGTSTSDTPHLGANGDIDKDSYPRRTVMPWAMLRLLPNEVVNPRKSP